MFAKSGIKGVDDLLDAKGIPKGYAVLVLGAPGSGKTTFGLQFLMGGIRQKEHGVFVTMDESPERLKENAESMGLDIGKAIRTEEIAVIDASPIRVIPAKLKVGSAEVGREEFALATLITSVTETIRRMNASRLVIDPISTLIVHFSDEYNRRIALLDLMGAISKTGCTTLLVSELSDPSLERRYQFDEFITDGVLVLTKILDGSSFTKVFSVEKMRGIAHDSQPHPYRIGEGGIEVFPNEQIF